MCFGTWMHRFGVPNFRRTFSHEHSQFPPVRHNMMFGSVVEHFATRMHAKRWETDVFRYLNAPFQGIELPTNVFARTHPIAFIRPKMKFGIVLEHFATRMHAKQWETGVFCKCFGVPNFRRTFSHEYTQLPPLDPIWSLVVRWSISLPECMQSDEKLVCSVTRTHYFGVPNFRRTFSHEHTQ